MVRTTITFLLLAALTACSDPDILSSTQCETPCYTGRRGTAGVGLCQMGTPVCDETGEVVECDGEVLPTEEIFDCKDNDCDGTIDNLLYTEPPLECGPPLEVGECRRAVLECVAGELACPGGVWPKDETCNKKDDDCDGWVDENLVEGPCYDGNPTELLHGQCRAGVRQCVNGEMKCEGQWRAESERCNREDDDCDGRIDEGLGVAGYQMLDIVLYADSSGSMGSSLIRLKAAFVAIGTRYADDDRFKFAIVEVPGHLDEIPEVKTDFVSGMEMAAIVPSLTSGHGGSEPTYDAPWLAAQGALGLSWRPYAKPVHILATDEAGQSYRVPRVKEEDVTEAILRTDGRFFYIDCTTNIWTDHEDDFDDIYLRTGGRNMALIELGDLELELEDVLTPCEP